MSVFPDKPLPPTVSQNRHKYLMQEVPKGFHLSALKNLIWLGNKIALNLCCCILLLENYMLIDKIS